MLLKGNMSEKEEPVELVGSKLAFVCFSPTPAVPSSSHLFGVSSSQVSLLCLWQVVPKTPSQQGSTDGERIHGFL